MSDSDAGRMNDDTVPKDDTVDEGAVVNTPRDEADLLIPDSISMFDMELSSLGDTRRAPPDHYQHWLNRVLRMSYSENAFQVVNVNPWRQPTHEHDHFFEVQHIVTFILTRHDYQWLSFPIGLFVDLALHVNDARNLFLVNRIYNRAKKSIPLADYRVSRFIASYLAATVDPRGNLRFGTVERSVRDLVRTMRSRTNIYNRLTKSTGDMIAAIMRWQD
ncbi:unnamed protein product [Peniophora sp. CBMAI 1063]|nr:unnamed protein product [Peniophora sp. CBMAI 1063]